MPSMPHHRSRAFRLVAEILLFSCMLIAVASVAARLFLWNISPSVPRGLYLLRRGSTLGMGSLVSFLPPPAAAQIIEARSYLPRGAGLLKRIVASPGDQVCIDEHTYRVNGARIGDVLTVDSAGRSLRPFRVCGPVSVGEAFVATSARLSFDSRYFGPVPLSSLVQAVPVWTY
jgi:conjugative transfer signal peptidase TraF